jgi:uncharacterized membrane protein YeaQ/YmgE (transglycosylase-associated protein family)
VLTYLILLALQGLVIGAFARLALPGKDPLSLPQTMAIGLAGSFIAGLVFYSLGGRGASPFLVALVFSTAIVYVIRRRRGGGLTSPGAAPARSPERRGR